jgi:hypothetical protein
VNVTEVTDVTEVAGVTDAAEVANITDAADVVTSDTTHSETLSSAESEKDTGIATKSPPASQEKAKNPLQKFLNIF